MRRMLHNLLLISIFCVMVGCSKDTSATKTSAEAAALPPIDDVDSSVGAVTDISEEEAKAFFDKINLALQNDDADQFNDAIRWDRIIQRTADILDLFRK